MKQDILIVQEIALAADRFYDDAERFGKTAAKAFRHRRSQMTGLERIANSTLKVSDVLDYLKRHTARDSGEKPVGWSVDKLGRGLITYLCNDLKQDRDHICASLDIDLASAEAQKIYMSLIREFVRQIVGHYEGEVTRDDT